MSLFDRLRGRPVVEDDAVYGTVDLDEDFSDGIRARIFAILKTRAFWRGLLLTFVFATIGIMWRYGSVPTSVPPVAVYKEVEGKTFVMELVRQMRDETAHGWVPNDLPYPRVLLLYRNAYQLGKHEVWQVAVDALRRQIAQDGRSVDPVENLDRAYFAISAAPDRIFMRFTEHPDFSRG